MPKFSLSRPRARKRGETVSFAKDEFPRAGTTAESLGKLRAAFKKDGSVTAGNASGINDGAAAAVVVMNADAARDRGLQPSGPKIRGWASAGVDPSIMGMGPWPACEKALSDRAGLSKEDIGLWELNEAFAAQSLGVLAELKIDAAKVNVNGGAIASGSPDWLQWRPRSGDPAPRDGRIGTLSAASLRSASAVGRVWP